MPTVDDYLKRLTPPQEAMFFHIRELVHQVVPDAGEKISYGIPTFTYKGTYLLYFGAFKHHMSLFPATGGLLDVVPELEPFKASKGTLRFTEDKPIPDELIIKMIKHHQARIDSGATA